MLQIGKYRTNVCDVCYLLSEQKLVSYKHTHVECDKKKWLRAQAILFNQAVGAVKMNNQTQSRRRRDIENPCAQYAREYEQLRNTPKYY